MSSFIAFHLKRILERAQAIYGFTVETKKLKWVFLRGLPLYAIWYMNLLRKNHE